MPTPIIKSLYYITHINNLASILRHGILSHQQMGTRRLPFEAVYNPEIVANRALRQTPSGKSLWEYANVYFQPRNPMLYKVVSEVDRQNVVILGVKPQILETKGAFISLGNAAVPLSPILDVKHGVQAIHREFWPRLNNDWWKIEDGTKRKIMAECLIPDVIPPIEIHTIYVATTYCQCGNPAQD